MNAIIDYYDEIEGDLIKLALESKFDVITHGCNCFCLMGAGLAPQMAKIFLCNEYKMEHKDFKGDINKLGTIDWANTYLKEGEDPIVYTAPVVKGWTERGYRTLNVVNSYTQYDLGARKSIPLDYEALTLCLRKINHTFRGKHIGLPQIGCGLAGGDWNIVKDIIQKELINCQITVVIYNNK